MPIKTKIDLLCGVCSCGGTKSNLICFGILFSLLIIILYLAYKCRKLGDKDV